MYQSHEVDGIYIYLWIYIKTCGFYDGGDEHSQCKRMRALGSCTQAARNARCPGVTCQEDGAADHSCRLFQVDIQDVKKGVVKHDTVSRQ